MMARNVDFALALRALKSGKSVRRECWEPDMRIRLERDHFIYEDKHETTYCDLCEQDLLANDWSIF